MLFSNTDIDILLRYGFLEQIQACTGRHGRSDANNLGILLAKLDQSLTKHLAVTRGFGLFGRERFAGGEIKS